MQLPLSLSEMTLYMVTVYKLMTVQIMLQFHTHNNICIWDVSIGELEDVCICDMYIESEVATVVFVHSLDTTRSLSFPA